MGPDGQAPINRPEGSEGQRTLTKVGGEAVMADGLVDVHAHFTTRDYIESAKAAGHAEPDGMPEAFWPRCTAEDHLDLMDAVGIERAMLSLSSPGVHLLHALDKTMVAEHEDWRALTTGNANTLFGDRQ
jgi:hypothetical protein